MTAWSNSTHPGSTRRQRTQRAQILARDPVCYLQYDCCTQTSTEEDHVQPLSQGGDRWSYSNRRGVCHECHARKTKQEAAHGRQRARTSALHPRERHPGLID